MVSTLKYFKIKKDIFKSGSAANPNKISSSSLKIIDYGINAFSLEHIESNLISLDVNESLNFIKLQFFNDQPPKMLPASIQNENSSLIDLKKIEKIEKHFTFLKIEERFDLFRKNILFPT